MPQPFTRSFSSLRSVVAKSGGSRPRFTIAAVMAAVAVSACLLSVVRRAWPVQHAEVIDPFAWVGDGFHEWKANEDYYNRILAAVAAGRKVPAKHLANFVLMSQPRMQQITGRDKFEVAEVLALTQHNAASLRMPWPSTLSPPKTVRSNAAGQFSLSVEVVIRAVMPIVLGAQGLLSPIIALGRTLGHPYLP